MTYNAHSFAAERRGEQVLLGKLLRVKTQVSVVILAVSSVMLLGCAASISPEPVQDTGQTVSPGNDVSDSVPPVPKTLSIDHISSCDDLESTMAPYIDGLTQMEGNSVNEWGVSCTWTMPEDNTDWANAREVSLGVTPVYDASTRPDIPGLQQVFPETAEITDKWIAELGGVAYVVEMGTGTVAALQSVVWTPDFEVAVGGGRWEGMPALDGNAALEVARAVLR
ncbi:hypothetical protein ACSS7Z_03090 [Microbacterium sp. A82]|uniref:hypothetical protein n=1 Tax=Microbacterium sp. A82 TaxID=3450452 RepID=UPI003F3F65DA